MPKQSTLEVRATADTVCPRGRGHRRYRQTLAIPPLFGRLPVALQGLKRYGLLTKLNGVAGFVAILQPWSNMIPDDTTWMDCAKARPFVGTDAGTKRPKTARRPCCAWAAMHRLTIEWEQEVGFWVLRSIGYRAISGPKGRQPTTGVGAPFTNGTPSSTARVTGEKSEICETLVSTVLACAAADLGLGPLHSSRVLSRFSGQQVLCAGRAATQSLHVHAPYT